GSQASHNELLQPMADDLTHVRKVVDQILELMQGLREACLGSEASLKTEVERLSELARVIQHEVEIPDSASPSSSSYSSSSSSSERKSDSDVTATRADGKRDSSQDSSSSASQAAAASHAQTLGQVVSELRQTVLSLINLRDEFGRYNMHRRNDSNDHAVVPL